MLTLLFRFLFWVALCSAVYFAAKHFHLTRWSMPVFAVVTLLVYLWWADRADRLKKGGQ